VQIKIFRETAFASCATQADRIQRGRWRTVAAQPEWRVPQTQFQEISREKHKDSMFVLLGIIALALIIVFMFS
jgi:hypothetical protein